jgi:hypothetical protein
MEGPGDADSKKERPAFVKRLCLCAGLDLESFMTDLDNLLELQNTLAAPSRDRDRLRKYSAADYQRLAIIGRRIFVLSLSQVHPLPPWFSAAPMMDRCQYGSFRD